MFSTHYQFLCISTIFYIILKYNEHCTLTHCHSYCTKLFLLHSVKKSKFIYMLLNYTYKKTDTGKATTTFLASLPTCGFVPIRWSPIRSAKEVLSGTAAPLRFFDVPL